MVTSHIGHAVSHGNIRFYQNLEGGWGVEEISSIISLPNEISVFPSVTIVNLFFLFFLKHAKKIFDRGYVLMVVGKNY